MEFDYTPEQIHLRKAVREFAEANAEKVGTPEFPYQQK